VCTPAVYSSSNFPNHYEDKTKVAGKFITCTLHDCTQSEQLKSGTNEDCAGEVISVSVLVRFLFSGYGCINLLTVH